MGVNISSSSSRGQQKGHVFLNATDSGAPAADGRQAEPL